MTVISWTFSEAQMGKDQLDVNFSYCSISFRSYVSGGNDILTETDMFKALRKHPVLGTSLILADVRCTKPLPLPLYDKCPLAILKVHCFEYNQDDVVVRHHNAIDSFGVWRTPVSAVQDWVRKVGFKTEPPTVLEFFRT